jgi:hypothetical protein
MANLELSTDLLRLEIETLRRQHDLDDDEDLRADMLEAETSLNDQLLLLARGLDDAKGLVEGTASRLAELSARKARFERRIEFFRELIAKLMESAGTRKIELPEVTLSMRNNPQRVVGDPDPDMLPDDLVKIVRTVSKTRIKEAIEQGREVPGCFLSNAPPSLVVRVK